MFDLKVIHSVLDQLEEERGIPKAKVIEAIELALATAYRKEYAKRGQIIRAKFDINSGKTDFYQVKIVVDESKVFFSREEEKEINDETAQEGAEKEADEKVLFNPEYHILIEDARKIKRDVVLGEEMIFPLEMKSDFGRIASQTAKQVIMQKIREAEKVSVLSEYGEREGEIVTGTVQRIERGTIFVDMGRATGIIPYEEQIPGERYSPGERVRAYLYRVEESPRGVFLRLSRSHPKFLEKLFANEAPEIANGTVEIKAVAREAGFRTKIAAYSNDEHIDPVGSMVGQRGVRVSTVMSELGGEKIDIIEWSSDIKKFIEDALSPAKVLEVDVNEENKGAHVLVSEDQLSLAIGKGGQNVRLAAKLTGWKIDIKSTRSELAESEDEQTTDEDETREVESTDGSEPKVDSPAETTENIEPEEEKLEDDQNKE
ncbi:MAG: transcription termination factor NusA [Candidatus Zambryskibacteria bacterium RIFCSPHIGHO2_01_FULL_43_25]|uniref:Transcription termination/antitermination protein NusA n=1 Tax=Candidatus Zambryskibacteria bacterium RIFCSPLOWO2_01_FULL_45_21 TaxID=1802761 RepID=A0A1G2U5I0_9BACT|nr:MAG: transcription termination factor NusA [Candidatus Zambryskibacteria bacterium RIFCSPHIGHO2_01_FULL_43_25]OHB00347.1 MAG: transcription termination factor NusA [Candidatus Zambryskibacteria bacterium RIFCSPHIGHO2_12_FULL_44_12b]OHB04738.1 MAG: transcription termination factor NusA [Candidatus Zambryskibacteria bacterium RIFCSPLOWO2_01_FULL_45_21]